MYSKHLDENSIPIEDGILEIIEVEISASALISNYEIDVPSQAYGFVIKRLPVSAWVKVNGQATPFRIDEGDVLSPYVKGVNRLSLTTTSTVTGSDKIVIHFIK